jgi:hypothetical protein
MYDRKVCQELDHFAPEFAVNAHEPRRSPARGAVGVRHEPDFGEGVRGATDFVVS